MIQKKVDVAASFSTVEPYVTEPAYIIGGLIPGTSHDIKIFAGINGFYEPVGQTVTIKTLGAPPTSTTDIVTTGAGSTTSSELTTTGGGGAVSTGTTENANVTTTSFESTTGQSQGSSSQVVSASALTTIPIGFLLACLLYTIVV